MAGKSGKSKECVGGTLGKLYLKGYNLIQALGWSYILYQVISYQTSQTKGSASLWETIQLSLIIFQSAAVLEIVHAATGLVVSNPVLTLIQVFSREMIVYGVVLATPSSYAASSIGLVLCLYTWSITEIIRYSYYFFNLLGFVPSFLTWARYTFFIVLYPMGITGELLCSYSAQEYARINQGAWSYTLPNSWNVTFSYRYALILIMLSYIPVFPQLYLHMFAQRRKILGSPATKTTKAH